MSSDIFAVVKEQLGIKDVAEHYGLEVNRGGFVSCPFHVEKNPSMKLYEDTDKYHCFGCGEHGDVIDLVRKLFNLAPIDAANKLAGDFGIAVGGRVYKEKPSIKAKMKSYDYELKERRAYRLLADYCDYLADYKRDLAPATIGEPLHPLFARALSESAKFEYYRDIFVFGAKDEKMAFMRDYNEILSGIEREMRGDKAVRAEELA